MANLVRVGGGGKKSNYLIKNGQLINQYLETMNRGPNGEYGTRYPIYSMENGYISMKANALGVTWIRGAVYLANPISLKVGQRIYMKYSKSVSAFSTSNQNLSLLSAVAVTQEGYTIKDYIDVKNTPPSEDIIIHFDVTVDGTYTIIPYAINCTADSYCEFRVKDVWVEQIA